MDGTNWPDKKWMRMIFHLWHTGGRGAFECSPRSTLPFIWLSAVIRVEFVDDDAGRGTLCPLFSPYPLWFHPHLTFDSASVLHNSQTNNRLLNKWMPLWNVESTQAPFRILSPDPNTSTRSLHSGSSHYTLIMHYFIRPPPKHTHTQTFFSVLQNSAAHSGDLVYSPRLWATES